ncbi:energy transducer TonB [Sphingomonas sp. G-3-2-10]|uniref:energy transducer TonB n=1 Tax=Sphingomonas sp. G-3-2-10 TaxID=2728838 RepID=UPI00146ADE20|nr:energy transducer TonB [Sphingomonas sp. G-3-2-10]NML06626.1 energy transducer TonB [Sphingomonas sp. G-3-2-10]
MWSVLAMIGAGLTPVELPVAMVQQEERTGSCTVRVQRSEKFRRGSHIITRYYFRYRNTCSTPIRLHYCNSMSSDQSQCAIGMYGWVDLGAGAGFDIRGPERSFIHVLECQSGEKLVESRSRVTGRVAILCEGAAITAAPEADPGAAFSGVGEAPNLSAPLAIKRPGMVLTEDDYPPRMLRIGAEGKTVVTLAINPMGRVTGCRVKRSSGFADLDRATCSVLMRRGRFNPGIDGAGNPVASVYPEYEAAWALH